MSQSSPDTALAVHGANQLEPWLGTDWQRLWLALEARPWTVVAFVPAGSGAPAHFTLNIAMNLARTGMVHLATPIQVADATSLQLSNVVSFSEEIQQYRAAGHRILVALPSVGESPFTESIAKAADFALLCVVFEKMSASQAKQTVSKIGKAHFGGSIIFRADVAPPVGATPLKK